jgi:hypothetical protein
VDKLSRLEIDLIFMLITAFERALDWLAGF